MDHTCARAVHIVDVIVKKIDLRTTCPDLSYVCHTYALNVLLCGPKICNKDSCIYLTTNCMKERDMGGVGTMIGTSASKRGWSGRGHMRARVGGLVANERCSLSKLANF